MFPLLPDPTAPSPERAWAHHSPAGPGPARPATPVPADSALERLLAGNRRFAAGTPTYGHRVASAMAAAGEPRPYAVVLGCMDARVAVEAVLDQDFGDVCVVRSAAHVVDRTTLGSIELAVRTFGIGLVLVLGHTRCAAVTAAVTMSQHRLPGRHTRLVLDEIRGAIPQDTPAAGRDVVADVVAETTRNHVRRTVTHLAAMLPAPTGVRVAGAIYDVGSARATVVTDARTG